MPHNLNGWDAKSLAVGFAAGLATAAAGSLLLPSLRGTSSTAEKDLANADFLEELEKDFHVSPQQLYEIMQAFIREMELGLSGQPSSMKMIPSFVTRRPTGEEKGTYLALDLGGTNFRVVQVVLEGKGHVITSQKKYTVSDAYKTGPGEQLFDFLAGCVYEFLLENNYPADFECSLGFTFSFPLAQHSLASGSLMEWTKGFCNPGVVSQDVAKMLTDAFIRKGMRIKVAALVNDTVGTLMALAYQERDVVCGVILGTGTNAAYVEKVSQIGKWKQAPPSSGEMIINMEWGGFDSPATFTSPRVLPVTKYDHLLDHGSAHPTQQIYEKMISGMYLGEITRIIIVDLYQRRCIFEQGGSGALATPYQFDTLYMSRIERDHSRDLNDTRTVLEEVLNIPKTTLFDRQVVKRVCELVGIRAARLAAVGVASVVKKIGALEGCTVGVDGSVYEHYPHFANRLKDALLELFGVAAENIRMMKSRDGSGIGAGLIAAMADER